ncbi:uncharacterized protein LOC130649322 [Hydractinia symbiolongicarpus]|uniref:uncharacterized protein LOC130649322 n=1 Tax=Hydractinia symbiolongicarpus TaxID=13093 RepID=UPI00254B38B9|nr:uncharacterized protein LOC130649322 [Hydractinia symbiolongicarpus]
MPAYTIRVWTPSGWKPFSRPDDMVVRFSVEGNVGKIRIQWKVDGFNVISHYSGNLFLITVSCNGGNTEQCFLAQSAGRIKYNEIKPTLQTTMRASEISAMQSTQTEAPAKTVSLLWIGSISGAVFFIIILIILATIICRRKSSDRDTKNTPFNQAPRAIVTQSERSQARLPGVISASSMSNQNRHPHLYPRPIPSPRKREQDLPYYITPNTTSDGDIPHLSNPTDVVSSQNANNQYAHVYLTATRPIPSPIEQEVDSTYYITPISSSYDESDLYSVIQN